MSAGHVGPNGEIIKDTGGIIAENVAYDHETSGLSANNGQEAIDELASEKQDKTDNTLQTTSKTIPGAINEINTALVAYGECSTARSTADKVVTITGLTVKTGTRIAVRFTDTGTSNPSSGNLTLQVNSMTAKTIVDGHSNKTVLTYSNAGYFYNNLVAEFIYDGTYWVYMNRDNNTTYTGATLKTNVAKTGSGTTVTTTIAASTTMDNAIGTLLNNDVALSSRGTVLSNSDGFTSNNSNTNKRVATITGITAGTWLILASLEGSKNQSSDILNARIMVGSSQKAIARGSMASGGGIVAYSVQTLSANADVNLQSTDVYSNNAVISGIITAIKLS